MLDGRRAVHGTVFGPFDGTPDGFLAAGNDALHLFGRHTESGGTFRRVKNPQPAAGARADIEEPAAALKGGRDHSHRPFDGPAHTEQSTAGARFLPEHEQNGFGQWHPIQVAGAGIALFGGGERVRCRERDGCNG